MILQSIMTICQLYLNLTNIPTISVLNNDTYFDQPNLSTKSKDQYNSRSFVPSVHQTRMEEENINLPRRIGKE